MCSSDLSLEMFREKCDGKSGCAVIVNARRGQVYGTVYGSHGKKILAPGTYMLDNVTSAVDGIRGSRGNGVHSGTDDSITFYGDGVTAYLKDERFAHLLRGRKFANERELLPTAGMVVRHAIGMRERGEECDFRDLQPDYMRETEAEQKLKDGTLTRLREKKMANLMNGHN